jgi:hypothetical protein
VIAVRSASSCALPPTARWISYALEPACRSTPPKMFPAALSRLPATPITLVWYSDMKPFPHLSQWKRNWNPLSVDRSS